MNKTKLNIHLIFVTKYRKKILDDDKSNLIINTIKEQCEKMQIGVKAISIKQQDHMHLILEVKPTHSISNVVQILKEKSRYAIWKEFPAEMRLNYWYKDLLWSNRYFCSSTGDASIDTIQKISEEIRRSIAKFL